MINWLYLLYLIPLSISSLTFYFFIHYDGKDNLMGFYTLLSGVLTTLFSVMFGLYYYSQKKKYGYFECECNTFLFIIMLLMLLWSIASIGIFYSSADKIPSMSSYGGFTIFYFLLFSLLLFIGFFILILSIIITA